MSKRFLSFVIIFLFIGSFIFPSIYGNIVKTQDSGFIAYWKLDEGNGDIAYDSINEFHGTIFGAYWITGKIGNALYFDGENDLINLPRNATDFIGSLEEGTITFWFNYTYNLNQQEIQPLFYMGIDDEDELDNMFIVEVGHKNPANRKLYVTWVINGGIPLCFDTGFNLEEKRWYHFALVVGSNGNTGYLDGVELINRHYNFGNAIDDYFFADIPAQDQFTIGYGKTADGKCPHFLYFNGSIDDIRIYDEPLSSDIIMEIYNYNEFYPPTEPMINGPKKGKPNIEHCWTFQSFDAENDDIKYYVDWGDGSQNDTECYPAGVPVTLCHTYNAKGGYTIIAKAQECTEDGHFSRETSFPFYVTNARAQTQLFSFIDMFPILQRLLNLVSDS